jgi:hypothetical protein
MLPNGRVRERAVYALAAAEDGRAVRWLCLRTSDWVAQVRSAALAGIERWLSPDHAVVLVDLLPLLGGGRFGSGRPADALRARVESTLFDQVGSLPAVREGAVSLEKSVRWACVRGLAAREPTVELRTSHVHC